MCLLKLSRLTPVYLLPHLLAHFHSLYASTMQNYLFVQSMPISGSLFMYTIYLEWLSFSLYPNHTYSVRSNNKSFLDFPLDSKNVSQWIIHFLEFSFNLAYSSVESISCFVFLHGIIYTLPPLEWKLLGSERHALLICDHCSTPKYWHIHNNCSLNILCNWS